MATVDITDYVINKRADILQVQKNLGEDYIHSDEYIKECCNVWGINEDYEIIEEVLFQKKSLTIEANYLAVIHDGFIPTLSIMSATCGSSHAPFLFHIMHMRAKSWQG